MRRNLTGDRAQLDAEDIEFDIYKRARELMELSCLKKLPEQEVQAGGVHLLRLTRHPPRRRYRPAKVTAEPSKVQSPSLHARMVSFDGP